jgi:hypothetical protein
MYFPLPFSLTGTAGNYLVVSRIEAVILHLHALALKLALALDLEFKI